MAKQALYGNTAIPRGKTPLMKFQEKTELIPFTTCWIWSGAVNIKGYGKFWINGKCIASHRFSYELYNGPIPAGLIICHSCDNPPCVNPDHLFLGTYQDNEDDKKRKNRRVYAKGEAAGASKLTAAQVLEIRAKYIPHTYSTYKLANEYGVIEASIYQIIKRYTWKHI